MRLTPHREMRPDSPALHAEQFRAPHQTREEPYLLDGTAESPQEHCHKSIRTLTSLQECEIAWLPSNQLKMKPDTSALAPLSSRIPHHTREVA